MKDKGTVISVKNGLAQVRVACFQACHDCSAHTLCIGHNQAQGVLQVRNPVQAGPGDEVNIEVPEAHYSRALMVLFGSLLAAALVGLGAGHLIALSSPISPVTGGIMGFLAGIAGALIWLVHYFRRANRDLLYPQITAITAKGDNHG